MKVKVSYTVDVSDGMRRAISHYYGGQRIATRAEVALWYEQHGGTMEDTLRDEHGKCCFQDEDEGDD